MRVVLLKDTKEQKIHVLGNRRGNLCMHVGVSAMTFWALIVVVGSVMFRSVQIMRGEGFCWEDVKAFNLSTQWFAALPIIVFGFQVRRRSGRGPMWAKYCWFTGVVWCGLGSTCQGPGLCGVAWCSEVGCNKVWSTWEKLLDR